MKAVFQREMHSLMHSLTGWLMLCAVPLCFAVFLYIYLNAGSADFASIAANSVFAFYLIVPVYAAQGFSKDRRTGADRLLHSLPLAGWKVVLGRFFAMCAPFLCGTLLACLYPAALVFFANLSVAQVALSMLLYALCGMALIAFSLCISRLSAKPLLNAAVALSVLVAAQNLTGIASWLSAHGMIALSALLLVALTAVWFGWKATRSLFSALVVGLIGETFALLFVGNDAASGALVWTAAKQLLDYKARFDSLRIGVLAMGDFLYFPLAAAVLLCVAACSWELERFHEKRWIR